MSGRARVAGLLVVLSIALAAQLPSAWSASAAPGEASGTRVVTALAHHDSSAVVPLEQMVRGRRGVTHLLGVPAVDLLAFVALLVLWCAKWARHRERCSRAIVPYRRRGPPLSPLVG